MMGDDAFKKEAIAATQHLLTNPVEIPNPNSFDRNNKRFLFNVLEMYNDQTFIESAQRMLVTDDGKIDDTVFSYLDVEKSRRLVQYFKRLIVVMSQTVVTWQTWLELELSTQVLIRKLTRCLMI